jgi:CelD/BcsL family acetyltransferase involved in cellulose biosynthesis
MQPFLNREAFDRAGPSAPAARLPIPRSASNATGSADSSLAAATSTQRGLALVTDRAGFEALEPEWNALFARAGRPWQVFQTFNWLWHWTNHYLDDRNKLCIVAGRREGRLVMVWPLVFRRITGLGQLSWMGEPVSEYGDVLAEEAPGTRDLLRQAWNLVQSLKVDVVYLRKIRDDAAILPLLAETNAISTGVSCAPYLDLASADSFETYQQRYSAKTRSSHRRHLRRLNELGPVTFEQHTRGPVARDLVSRALIMKRGWLAQRGRLSRALQDRRFGRFLADVAQGCARPTGARISVVRCNGEPIGVEISFACKGHVFGHVIAHDLAFQKQGVGSILAQYSIGTAHREGHFVYDLLAPDDAYKMNWADACIGLRDCTIPISRIGGIYARLWLRFARPWLKSLANRMPARIVSLLSSAYRA